MPVYAMEGLGAGQVVPGPAFVESEQTTVVVHPGMQIELAAGGDLIMMPVPFGEVVPLRAGGRA